MKKLFPLALLLLVAGCRGRSSLPPGVGASPNPLPPPISVPPVETAPDGNAAPAALSFSATANRKTLRRGDTLLIEMTLRNEGKTVQPLRYTSSQDFDLQVRRIGEKDTAWTWSMDKMFSQALRTISLRPNGFIKMTATWDGTAGGTRLPRGAYELTAISSAQPSLQAAPIKISIE